MTVRPGAILAPTFRPGQTLRVLAVGETYTRCKILTDSPPPGAPNMTGMPIRIRTYLIGARDGYLIAEPEDGP